MDHLYFAITTFKVENLHIFAYMQMLKIAAHSAK